MQFKVKRGEQLTILFTRTDANGLPVDISADTITAAAALRAFSAALTATKTDAPNGEFTLSAAAAATATWPVATLDADVRYDAGGGAVRKSETFRIKVEKEITP